MAGSGQLHVFPDATVTSTDQSAILPKLSPDGGGAPGDADALSCKIPTAFSDPDNPVNVVTAVITGLYLFFGIFSALFGYRCFKAIMFLTGFIFGSIVVYLICLEEGIFPLWANTVIAVSAGILFGLITLLVQYVGLFMLGFHGGLLAGIVGLVTTHLARQAIDEHNNTPFDPHSPWASVAVLLASGLVASLFNLYFQKSLTIFNSALYGGAVVATGVDYFVENSVMLVWVWNKVRSVKDPQGLTVVGQFHSQCWYSWLILALWPVITIIGICSQCVVSGNGIYHEEQFSSRRAATNGGGNSKRGNRSKPESREERKQRKYRYLYQVRTCHGDVISQPISKKYVQQVDEPCA